MKKFILFSLLTFSLSHSLTSFAQAPATCTAAIGSPANGAAHYISVSWAAVGGATSYDLEYSTNGSTWNNLYTGTSTSYNHNTGAVGNLPYYYHVRATVGGNPSSYTNATQYPIYSACDVPALPQLSNANPYTMTLDIVAETPDANPAYTTYSIYCEETSQYVQANGTLGASEVFQTNAAWGAVTVNGLSDETDYCFYLKAKNMDGDIRMATGSTIMTAEPFNTSNNFSTGASTTSRFWSPASCGTGGLVYSSSGGCAGGYVGYSGSFNNYFGCFLRTPQQNCTGNSSVVLNFDISNSYFANHANDKARFYMWVDNGYVNATSVKINGVEVGVTDINGIWLKFDQARTCVNVDVTFDLTSSTNLSNILFYIEPNCGYNDSQVFSVKLDNISLREGSGASACLSTSACLTSGIGTSSPASVTACVGGTTTLTITTNGNTPTYQWEESTDGGANWLPITDGGIYSGATTASLSLTGVTTGLQNYQYHCIASYPCGGSSTSNTSTITVNDVPASPLEIGGPVEICENSAATYAFGPVNNATSYTWTLPAGWSGTSTSTTINATVGDLSDYVTATANNGCGSSAPTSVYVIVDLLPFVQFNPNTTSFCINNGLVALTQGSPQGGYYTGVGVSGSNFNPATAGAGDHDIVYHFTDITTNCVNTDTATFTVDLCTGIGSVAVEGIAVFPNPFSDFVMVKFNAAHESGTIIITDITGKEIARSPVSADDKQLKLSVAATAKGIYSFAFISSSGKTERMKLQRE